MTSSLNLSMMKSFTKSSVMLHVHDVHTFFSEQWKQLTSVSYALFAVQMMEFLTYLQVYG